MGPTHYWVRKLGMFSVLVLATACLCLPIQAAELVDVIDAADGDDPFDLRADVEFC
jgi:hypothetical protein